MALIAVTEESKLTTAGAITGLAGLLLGGVWVGAAGFAAGSYLARKKDDDVSKALNGIAGAGLEVLNFASNLNTKYEVTGKISSSFNDAVKSNDTDLSALDGVSSAVTNFDKDVGIQKTLGVIGKMREQYHTLRRHYEEQLEVIERASEAEREDHLKRNKEEIKELFDRRRNMEEQEFLERRQQREQRRAIPSRLR